jgi:hypothetical protein
MRQDARSSLDSDRRAMLLCGESAQTVAAQLMEDVRRYELEQHVSGKIGATLTPR